MSHKFNDEDEDEDEDEDDNFEFRELTRDEALYQLGKTLYNHLTDGEILDEMYDKGLGNEINPLHNGIVFDISNRLSKNRTVLSYNDGIDLWFYINANPNYLVYCQFDDNEELGLVYYTEILVNNIDFNLFKTKQISYLELFKKAIKLSTLTWHYNNEITDKKEININIFNLLPHHSLYHP